MNLNHQAQQHTGKTKLGPVKHFHPHYIKGLLCMCVCVCSLDSLSLVPLVWDVEYEAVLGTLWFMFWLAQPQLIQNNSLVTMLWGKGRGGEGRGGEGRGGEGRGEGRGGEGRETSV